jgi:hypothetical protein
MSDVIEVRRLSSEEETPDDKSILDIFGQKCYAMRRLGEETWWVAYMPIVTYNLLFSLPLTSSS